MSTTESIEARIEPKLKAEAENVLAQLGLSASEAIRVFYRQVVLRQGLPFDVVIPNAQSRRAMRDVQAGRGLTENANTAELRKRLGL